MRGAYKECSLSDRLSSNCDYVGPGNKSQYCKRYRCCIHHILDIDDSTVAAKQRVARVAAEDVA